MAFTSPERFHTSVADSSFSIWVVLKSHCLGEPAGSCPLFVFWFRGVASGRPPSSGLFDSLDASYHIDLGCWFSLSRTQYVVLV